MILQSLLKLAESVANQSEGKFDVKACFFGVKLNGKPNWNPPAGKDQNGNFDPIEKAGNLTFTFTVNPVLYKQLLAKMQTTNPDGNPATPA